MSFLFARYSYLLIPVVHVLGFQLVLAHRSIYIVFIIQMLLLFAAYFVSSSTVMRDRLHFMLLPGLFHAGVFFTILFAEGNVVSQSLIYGSAFFEGLLLKITFDYFYRPMHYQAYSLENFTTFLNTITAFFSYLSLYALIVFLNLPLWQVALGSVFIGILLSYNYYWIAKIALRISLFSAIVLTIMTTEIFWVMNFLPTGIYVNAFVVASTYYILSQLTRHSLLKKKIEGRWFPSVMLIYFLSLVIVLLTAQWR